MSLYSNKNEGLNSAETKVNECESNLLLLLGTLENTLRSAGADVTDATQASLEELEAFKKEVATSVERCINQKNKNDTSNYLSWQKLEKRLSNIVSTINTELANLHKDYGDRLKLTVTDIRADVEKTAA